GRTLREDRRARAGCDLREMKKRHVTQSRKAAKIDFLCGFAALRDMFLIPYRVETFSSVGKSSGTFCVTLPVAAHSAPRASVARKPTHFSAGRSWPSVVWNARPLP